MQLNNLKRLCAVLAVLFFTILGTFLLAYPSHAYTLEVSQTSHNTTHDPGAQELSEAEYNVNTNAVVPLVASSELATQIGMVATNTGSSCTGGTWSMEVQYCTTSASAGCSTPITYTSTTTDLAAGATEWIYFTHPTGVRIDRIHRFKMNQVTGGTNCGTNLNTRYQTGDPFDGTDVTGTDYWQCAAVNGDCAFEVYSGSPPPVTTGTIEMTPDAAEVSHLQQVYFQLYSDIDGGEYPNEEVSFDFVLWDTGPTPDVMIVGENIAASLVGDTYFALTYAPTLPPGSYEAWSSVCVVGYGCGTDAVVAFDVLATGPFGGGGGGSWSAPTGEGGFEDWTDFYDAAVASQPDCDFWGAPPDGLACLWSWIRYAIVPPEEVEFNFLATPWNTLLTRWPLSYLAEGAYRMQAGFVETDCPIPDITAVEYASTGMESPEIVLCDWFEDIQAAVVGSTALITILSLGLWVSFVIYAVGAIKRFFH